MTIQEYVQDDEKFKFIISSWDRLSIANKTIYKFIHAHLTGQQINV